MAQEYVMMGQLSEKSRCLLFWSSRIGDHTLEKGTLASMMMKLSLCLLRYAWKLWNKDNALDFIDKRIWSSRFLTKIMRCMHIGLLCVQESPVNRPAYQLFCQC